MPPPPPEAKEATGTRPLLATALGGRTRRPLGLRTQCSTRVHTPCRRGRVGSCGGLLASRLFKAVQMPIRRVAYSSTDSMMTNPNRTCPTCGTRDGIPKTVTAFRRMIRLALVCRTCRHAWAVEWPPSAPTTITTAPPQPQESKAESPHRFFDQRDSLLVKRSHSSCVLRTAPSSRRSRLLELTR